MPIRQEQDFVNLASIYNSSHRPSYLAGQLPAFLAPTATLVGDVRFGNECSVWFGAVLRGDINHVALGDRANVQDNCVLHVSQRDEAQVPGVWSDLYGLTAGGEEAKRVLGEVDEGHGVRSGCEWYFRLQTATRDAFCALLYSACLQLLQIDRAEPALRLSGSRFQVFGQH